MQGTAIQLTAKQAAPASKSAARLSVSLVGRLTMDFNGSRIELRTQKAAAVLGYLALSGAKHESRERLVGLLWSRSDEARARASLRQVVRELRSVFDQAGYCGFAAGRLAISLKTEQLEVDIDNIIRLAENGWVHSLLVETPQLCERLFEGMDDLDPSFRVWLLAKRQTIHDRLMRSLGASLMNVDTASAAKTALATAIVNLDPTHEEACCHLMRAHAVNGDVAGALRIYKGLWELLDRDYGMEPSLATEALVANIKLGAFERPAARYGVYSGFDETAVGWRDTSGFPPAMAASPSLQAPVKMRLMLRPFAMHGIDHDHAHLVLGFRQHLAACLVRFREWSVVDRAPAAVTEPALEAALQYCIETTAYQAGSEINMVMVLKDDSSGIYVWSESFRLDLDNWFETQQRIIRRIAMSLNVQLSAERLMRLAGEPDISLDTHDRWLRGQSLMLKFDPESWRRAVSIFREAIRGNPTFSPCLSSLVQMYNVEHFVHPGLFRNRDKAMATLELAKAAVQLDPVDSRAHLCCGWSNVLALRGAEAAPHMELACELNDNDPWTLLSTAAYCSFHGSIEQARRRARQSLALSLTPSQLEWGYHSIIRFLCGDYADALEAFDQASDVMTSLPAFRAAALFELGQPVMAQQEAQRFLNMIRSFWVGSVAPTDNAIARWLLQAHPIGERTRWETLRRGLHGAGLPVEGVTQLSW
jgi:DNA-binding SARP family transcriptional activator/TolB-like protein